MNTEITHETLDTKSDAVVAAVTKLQEETDMRNKQP
jgi:hypothetical protein